MRQKLVAMVGSKKSHRQDQMFKLIEACHQSGLTNKAFCRQQGLHPQVFYYWQRKYRQRFPSNKPTDGCSLIPLELKEDKQQSPTSLEIHYPNGVKVILHDEPSLDQLANLINVL